MPADTILWQDGWYRYAKHIRSPNFGLRPDGVLPELVVLHSISLPPGVFGNGAIEALFLNQLDWSAHPYYEKIHGATVSSHFVIDRHGVLTQYVSCNQRAWHAGRSCWQGRPECNDWSIGVELEGLEGLQFEDFQYETLSALIGALCECYPIAWVAGHEHIAPERKQDPGPGFDWTRLKAMTGLSSQAFPPKV